MNIEAIEKVANAVLYEGYLLYPYTAGALKNRQRWTFGGVYPWEYSEATGGHDPWLMQTECLVLGDSNTTLEVKIRFLHVVERRVEERTGDGFRQVEELRVEDQVYRPWEEAMEREAIPGATSALTLGNLCSHPVSVAIDIPAGSARETLTDADGKAAGALVREWRALAGSIEVGATRLQTDNRLHRLTIRITNTTAVEPGRAASEPRNFERSGIIRQTLVSTHTAMTVVGGEFISLLEPDAGYQAAVEGCENIKTWPVLVGEQGERDMVLSSPIILYDYPQVSPETPGDMFDATEIDELLRLSVMSLTEEEKREMRETDPRGREILEATEALTPEQLMNLHGAVRGLQSRRRDEP